MVSNYFENIQYITSTHTRKQLALNTGVLERIICRKPLRQHITNFYYYEGRGEGGRSVDIINLHIVT